MRSHENEAFTLSRNTQAVMVPSGDAIELQAGLSGFITQALGGSFTLYIEGNLYRLSGENADAIGKQALTPPALPPGATEDDIKSLAWQQMRSCYDPEIPIDIVELGLVYECDVSANEDGTRTLAVKMTLTAPGCGMGPVIAADAQAKIMTIEGVDEARVELVWDPAWNQEMISEEGRMKLGMV